MEFFDKLDRLLKKQKTLQVNLSRRESIRHAIENKEVFISANGALAVFTPTESTGRSPKDTVLVKRPEIVKNIDWDSPNNLPLDPATFDMICQDALDLLEQKPQLYIDHRVVGADSSYALPIKSITDRASGALFTHNMFRPVPADLSRSIFANREFTLITLPYDKLDQKRYEGRLRKLPDGSTSDLIVSIDFVNNLGIIIGSAYFGSMKKLIFTVMNYLLPEKGILPLHTSANEGKKGDMALFLGLSGTGKTTLSADPGRALLGDDEHGWDDKGIANFEYGCYAKLINLNPDKEPEIYRAITHPADVLEHGALVENAMMYPQGHFDFTDARLTENSRGSYPLSFLSNIKESSCGGHPSAILFLTADANGVLPPVAKLTEEQAMLWFLMGYTSKLAGTERGIIDPVSTFSRFFGAPFMPRNPDDYASLLGAKLKQHRTQVFLVNTGWSGGPYGVGKRMDIDVTRKIVTAVLQTQLQDLEFEEDPLFHILIPKSFPGIDPDILHPRRNWADKEAFDKRASQLAAEFAKSFDKAYGNKNLAPEISRCCPGK